LERGFPFSGAAARPQVPVKYNSPQKILSQLCHIIQKTVIQMAENFNGIIWLIRMLIPPFSPTKTPRIVVYWIPPVFLFSDLWAKSEELISLLVVLNYLQFLRSVGAFFATGAITQMCGIVSRPPHLGRSRGFDSYAVGIPMPIPEGVTARIAARGSSVRTNPTQVQH
jgi:hypothetical protein